MAITSDGIDFTINPSGPGVLAGTSVTFTNCTLTSNVTIAFSTKVVDALGSFNDVTVVPGAGVCTVTCNRAQLPSTLTGNLVLVNTA